MLDNQYYTKPPNPMKWRHSEEEKKNKWSKTHEKKDTKQSDKMEHDIIDAID